MQDKKENNEIKTVGKKNLKKRFAKIFWRTAFFVVLFFTLLSGILIILSQTHSFRKFTADFVLNILNNELTAKVEVSDIKLNPFSGIEISDFKMITRGDTFASAKKVVVDYKVLPLFSQKIVIEKVVLDSPDVRMLKSLRDSLWNTSFIAKPSKTKSSSSSPNIKIDVFDLVINNGKFLMFDSTKAEHRDGAMDFSHLRFNRINLSLSAILELSKPKFDFNIRRLSCVVPNTGLNVNRFALQTVIDTIGIHVAKLKMVTDRTDLALTGSITKFNIFGGIKLDYSVFDFKIESENVHLPDINHISAFRPNLGGDFNFKANVYGTLNNLYANELIIKNDEYYIAMKGGVKNLLNPKHFSWEGEFKKTLASHKILKTILPEMDLSSVPQFRTANLAGTYALGTLDSIGFRYNLVSDLGNSHGNGYLTYGNGFIINSNITAEKVNLSKVMPGGPFDGTANCNIKVDADGLKLSQMKAKLDINGYRTNLNKYLLNDYSLRCTVADGGIISLDTLGAAIGSVALLSDSINPARLQKIALQGKLDLRDMEHPKYDLIGRFENFNPAFMLENSHLPEKFGGKIDLNGEGFKPDSIICDLKSEVTECSFNDRSLMPFALNLKIVRGADSYRKLSVESDLADLTLEGKYNFDNIISLIKNQLNYLSSFFIDKANLVNTDFTMKAAKASKTGKITSFAPINFRLKANVNDLSLLNAFLEDMNLYLKAGLDVTFDVSDTVSKITIDSMNIESFQFNSKSASILIKPVTITSGLRMVISDSLPLLSDMKVSVNSDFDSDLNGIILSNPNLKLNYTNENTSFSAGVMINNLVDIKTDGNLKFGKNRYFLELLKTSIELNNSFLWTSTKPILASLGERGLNIEALEMSRENAETISVSGKVNTMFAKSLKLDLKNLPLNEFNKFLPSEQQKIIKSFKGSIEFVHAEINDSLSNPDIKVSLATNSLSVNSIELGSLKGELNHKNFDISGGIHLVNPKKNNSNTLDITINSFPFNAAIASVKERIIRDKRASFKVDCNDMPLTLAAPFIPPVNNLKGALDAEIEIGGFLPSSFEYKGKAKIKNASFLLEPNYLSYFADGNIELETNKILIRDFNLYNVAEDLPDGHGKIDADINLDNFALKDFSFRLSSKKLKILGPQSFRTMPNLFGDFIISTGTNPLQFSGSLQSPRISGDVNIIRADLNLPQQNNTGATYSTTVRYEIEGGKLKVKVDSINVVPDAQGKITANGVTKAVSGDNNQLSFSDRLAIDLYAKIIGRFIVTIDLSILGQIYAEIGTPDYTQALHIVKITQNPEIKILGGSGLVLKEGSTLKYLKLFKTTGNITFPTGSVTNPGLDLSAVYDGQSYIGDNSRNFRVTLKLTGTKDRPNIKFGYSIRDEDATGDSSLISQNAMFLLATGKTKTELETGSRGGGLNFSEIGTSSISASISKMATDLLQGTGVIRSADIDLSGGSVEKANLKLSGQLFGNVIWRVGGTVADIASNNEISIDVPLGIVIHPELLNNIILQLTKSTSLSQNFSRNQKEWEVKLKFGGSW